MNQKTADTPIKALVEHASAFSSKNNSEFANGLSYPFIHLWADNQVTEYIESKDVDLTAQFEKAGIDPSTFGKTELDEAELILDWCNTKAFRVKFTRFSMDGQKVGQAEALWVVACDNGTWKMKLRIGAAPVK